jgi:potassium channel subfamily K
MLGLWEALSMVDALYFVIVTITTVGYGDLVPLTDKAKIFTVFFMVAGLVCFARELLPLSA